jgi:hypothetical protein
MSVSTNAARLRSAIDSGQTGDKVAGSDPTAAPLGTDDEASGAAPSSSSVSVALRNEVGEETPPKVDYRLAEWGFMAAIVLIGMLFCSALWMRS